MMAEFDPREAITKESRFWVSMAAEMETNGGNPMRAQQVAKYTAQVLCPHTNIKQSGTQWQCLDCEGHT